MPRRALLLVLCLAGAVSSVAAAPPAAHDPPAQPGKPQAQQKPQAQGKAQGEAARLARRDRHRALLAALWGSASAQPAGLAEFRLHAWRMARLRRMERLATELARPALVERIGSLLAEEEARHLKHMKRLEAPAAPASAEPSPKKPPAPPRPPRND